MAQHTLASGDAAITKAIAEGRIPEDARGRYQMEFSRSPQSTLDLLQRLERTDPSVLAATAAATAPTPHTPDEEAYPATWLNHLPQSEREFIRAAQEDRSQQSRVVIEQ
jgi:hypothetical protein